MAVQNNFPSDAHIAKQITSALPGLVFVASVAGAAIALKSILAVPLLGPMVLAMLMGVALRNTLGGKDWAEGGIALAQRPLMRIGIVLLGLQLSLGQIWQAGTIVFVGIAVLLFATYYSTQFVGRALGVPAGLSRLIGAGTAVCGASAIMAVQGARPARSSDLAYAIACVTLFGTLSMLALPVAAMALGLDGAGYGLWAGAAIHEVGQVVGATNSYSVEAQHWGMMAKLSRVLLLAPLIVVLIRSAGAAVPTAGGKAPAPLPLFVAGFAAMMVLGSTVSLPDAVLTGAAQSSSFLLTMALGAMGLSTDIGALRREGLRPLLLGAYATVFVTLGALALVYIAG
ncbi:putative sulfate exporter family transporter [Phaeobacter sp. CNT1-3]|nr:putative sulfate exporter family transporter [Phaeobacter sp. CNT1-3]